LVEIFVVGSCFVLILHFSIPSFFKKDILLIKKELSKQSKNSSTPAIFNAADHLFVSTRIARKFPQLPISNAILQYNTVWPSKAFQKSFGESKTKSNKGIRVFNTILSQYVLIVLNIFINASNNIQDFMIQFISISMVDGLIIICTTLYNITPALIALPISIVVFCVYVFSKAILNLFNKKDLNIVVSSVHQDCLENENSGYLHTDIRDSPQQSISSIRSSHSFDSDIDVIFTAIDKKRKGFFLIMI
jgi:hypothetical protein